MIKRSIRNKFRKTKEIKKSFWNITQSTNINWKIKKKEIHEKTITLG